MSRAGNLFADIGCTEQERFDELLSQPGIRIERIVSTGQSTPEPEWLVQDWAEWVLLLSGGAGLLLEGEAETRTLAPGDWLLLPAGVRHRVEWTQGGGPTVWLAVHIGDNLP
ncbi:MAG: hypothetical protein JWM36_415 [Hyphomicrobiales bacterium]|nr:hypothetical protein [Hyphomicrobiales bacterium]